ncbi:uncharacterized protein [Spinacia oleracea]|uniref:Uncharacterized protein n=1 Tax=Spinacia oleracea TaxID=3562 RepID=A0ABM3QS68_SPIOL|nr:uncharacterized protein LOC130461904 [Spinacia oleracea]
MSSANIGDAGPGSSMAYSDQNGSSSSLDWLGKEMLELRLGDRADRADDRMRADKLKTQIELTFKQMNTGGTEAERGRENIAELERVQQIMDQYKLQAQQLEELEVKKRTEELAAFVAKEPSHHLLRLGHDCWDVARYYTRSKRNTRRFWATTKFFFFCWVSRETVRWNTLL